MQISFAVLVSSLSRSARPGASLSTKPCAASVREDNESASRGMPFMIRAIADRTRAWTSGLFRHGMISSYLEK